MAVELLFRGYGGAMTSDQCCSGTGLPDAGESGADGLAAGFRLLGDPTRLKLLSILAGRECDDVCACDLSDALELTPATISHHMKKLVDAGMVAVERRGRWAHYRLLPAGFAPLRAALEF